MGLCYFEVKIDDTLLDVVSHINFGDLIVHPLVMDGKIEVSI